MRNYYCLMLLLLLPALLPAQPAFTVKEDTGAVRILAPHYQVHIAKQGFRYAILRADGAPLLAAHEQSGLTYLGVPVARARLLHSNQREVRLETVNTLQVKAVVTITPHDHYFRMQVALEDSTMAGSITARTGGAAPVYGLGDHPAWRQHPSTEVSGYSSSYFGALTDGHSSRLVSNFVISPRQGIACVHIEPGKKRLHFGADEWMQGTDHAAGMPSLYYFTGSPQQIYRDYLEVRNAEGYTFFKPKYEWFGVGWEAYGALGWETNHRTISENIDTYLGHGFPLSWMVIGSGFWPNHEARFQATTSFGLWDSIKYPDPPGLIRHFHQKGLKVILGLRIAFMPNGPYTAEGVAKGYFIKREGRAKIFRVAFPKSDCYFLDGDNPAAVQWYMGLCRKWLDAGADGFKEDLFGYETTDFPDTRLNAVNTALMQAGVYVMGRNGYISSPMDLHRFEDFNYNQNQDRGPVNGLAFAYSGFPFVYPDIVGGTGLAGRRLGNIDQDRLKTYLMRYAVYAALNPSMSFGYGVWNLQDPQVLQVCLDAARLHARLHPYFYSAAVRTAATGYPYTMTPLPLAYPDDKNVHDRENDRERGYQWLIGDALMAIPLYGNDYATAQTRNIYLPAGKWIDYNTGRQYQGPALLKDLPIPVDKAPLLVGGTGFVVEQVEGRLYGRVYPTGYQGVTEFYGRDGRTRSAITLKGSRRQQPVVRDVTTKQHITVTYRRHAYEFELTPGHNYEIE